MLLNWGGGDKNVHSHIPVQHSRTNLHMEGLVFFPLLLEFFVMCAAALYYVMQTGRASGSQRAAERAPLGGWMCFVEHGNSVSLGFKETMLL